MALNARSLGPAAVVLALGALGVGLTACGGSTDATTAAATSTAVSTAADMDGATTTATASTASTATMAADADGASPTSTSTGPVVTTITVVLGKPKEFSLVPQPGTAPAGKITFRVRNEGAMVHEFSVVTTTADASKLPVTNGQASEAGTIGESGDLKAGASKDVTMDLTPGHYVLLCNLAGHHHGGMYANFTVK